MKKLGVAAILMLVAFGASASNFRAADQVYVPVAGHAAGSSGTFISDAFIANLSSDDVDVSVIYVPRGQNAGAGTPVLEEIRGKITLTGYERKELLDIFPNTLDKESAFGMLVFNGCKADEDCGPDTQDEFGYSENFRPISVQTRIYQITQAGANPPTTGQLFSGLPWYSFVSQLQSSNSLDKVFITGLTQTGGAGQAGTFRSNLGVVNASEYSTTQIVFRLYQGTMTEDDKKAEKIIDLGPLGNQLFGFNDLFPGFTGSNFFVTVEQRNSAAVDGAPDSCDLGCPGFFAYGSVLDNISGDATTMEAQYLVEMSAEALDVLYPQGSGKGNLIRMVRK